MTKTLHGWLSSTEMENNAYKEYIRSGIRYDYYLRLENLTIDLSNLNLVILKLSNTVR